MSENKLKNKGFLDIFWRKEEEELSVESVKTNLIQRTDIQTNVGIMDKKFADHLAKIMDDANLTGHDYYELKQALKAMDALQIDENAKFQAAYATLSTMGVSVAKLIDSANQYIEILNKEKTNFTNESNQQKNSKVDSKLKEIETLNQEIQKKTEQILQLNNEINTSKQNIAKLNLEISDNSIKIQNTENNFNVTHANFVAKIQSDIEKMKTFLNK